MRLKDLIDFWPVFLAAHLAPWNRRFHLIGNFVMLSCWIGFFITADFRLLLLSLVGYIPSWLGHLFFEGKEPPTFKYPLLSALSNFKMVSLILNGEINNEVQRLFGPNAFPGSEQIVSPDQERLYQEQLKLKVSDDISHPFTEYWPIFVLKHQNSVNVWVHVVAMYYLYMLILISALTLNWQLLILVALSPVSGLIAHRFIERSHVDFEDSIFSFRAFKSLNKMMYLASTGRYWAELENIKRQLNGK